jgi:mono/diheme cytochrome c family protein
MRRTVRSTPLLPALLLAASCNAPPPDTREWKATDHDHTDNPTADQVVGGPDGGTPPELARHGLNEVTIVAWQQNCVRCHGRMGRGDGPQGRLVRAPDLTNPEWQSAVTDEALVKTLREGRGLMPAFDLPEPTLLSLVQLVRLLGRASNMAEAPAGSVASPPPSAPKSAGPAPAGATPTPPPSASVRPPLPSTVPASPKP